MSPTTEELAITLSLRNIIEHEGYRARIYLDTKGHRTGGFGSKRPASCPYRERDTVGLYWSLAWLSEAFVEAIEASKRIFTTTEFSTAGSVRWAAIIELCYWMGEAGLRDGFPRFCVAFREKRWLAAGLELIYDTPETSGAERYEDEIWEPVGSHGAWVNQGEPTQLWQDTPTRTRTLADMIATGREG